MSYARPLYHPSEVETYDPTPPEPPRGQGMAQPDKSGTAILGVLENIWLSDPEATVNFSELVNWCHKVKARAL